jgi:hypothetical protein
MHSSTESIPSLRPMFELRTDPALIPDLQTFLLRAGCAAVQVGTDTIEVYAPLPSRPGSERDELLAVVSRWLESHPGAFAELAA